MSINTKVSDNMPHQTLLEYFKANVAFAPYPTVTLIEGNETAKLWPRFASGNLVVRPLSQPPTSLLGSALGPIVADNCFIVPNEIETQDIINVRVAHPNATQFNLVVKEVDAFHGQLMTLIRVAYIGLSLRQVNIWVYRRQADGSVQAWLLPECGHQF